MNNRSERLAKVYFTLPALLVMSVIMAFPIIFTFGASFTDWGLSAVELPNFVSLDNYSTLLGETRFFNSIKRMLHFSVATSVVETILGIGFAIIFNKEFRAQRIVKTICLLPYAATPIVVGIVWKLILDPTLGVANFIIGKLGIPPITYFNAQNGLTSLICIEIWQGTPIVALIVVAAMSNLPLDCLEAASVDGATGWKKFWTIELPLLMPTIFIAFLMRFLDVTKAFDIIYSITKGGPMFATETLNLYGYVLAFQHYKFGKASALIVMYAVILTIVGALMLRVKKNMEVDY